MELIRREMISPEKRETIAAGISAESSNTMHGSHTRINCVSGVSGAIISTATAMPESSSDERRTEINRCFFMPSPIYLIAYAAYRLYYRAELAELLPQSAYMYIHRSCSALEGVAPYAV